MRKVSQNLFYAGVKMKRFMKVLQLLVCVGVMLLCLDTRVAHAGSETDENRTEEGASKGESQMDCSSSIVKIVTVYSDEDGNLYYVKQGTGFVIGVSNGASENSGKKYILSDYGIVEGEIALVNEIKRRYGLPEDSKLSLMSYAIGDMGVLSELKIISYSNETRYVVLEPSTELADKQVLRLGSGASIETEARIHIEGYSGLRSIFTNSSVTERNINVYDTTITDVYTEDYYNDAITYFYVGEPIDEGMAGAPVLDADGCVIGMFIYENGSPKLMAMSVDNLRQILDALAINYMVAEDDITYDIPTDEQKAELKRLVIDNKEYISSINRNFYTSTTWNTLYEAISKADDVCMSAKSTAKQYDDNIAALKSARKKLKTKAFKWKLINVIAGVVVVVLVIIMVRVLKKRKRIQIKQQVISNMGK